MDVNELLRYMVERGASDLHLKVGNAPYVRVDGILEPARFESLSSAETETFAQALMSEHKRDEFGRTREAEVASGRA